MPHFAEEHSESEVASSIEVESDSARRPVEDDSEGITRLYDRYSARLYQMLMVMLDSPHDAEDAVQEVFVRLIAARIEGVRDVRAYLFRAARNEALNMIRGRRRSLAVDEVPAELAAPEVAPNRDLLGLLRHLPPEQREVVSLKVYEEMTFAEIAAIVDASPNTVAGRYRYGISKLRSLAEEATDD